MAEAYGSSSCLPVLAPKSMLLHTRTEIQGDNVPLFSRHKWQKHRFFEPKNNFHSIHELFLGMFYKLGCIVFV